MCSQARQAAFFIIALLITVASLHGGDKDSSYDLRAKVESLRKGDQCFLIFQQNPGKTRYLIIENDEPIGIVNIIQIYLFRAYSGTRFRVFARYGLFDKKHSGLIRAGASIGLRIDPVASKRDYAEPKYRETIVYKKKIFSPVDGREMVFIESGKFIFGTSRGEKDEGPQQTVYLRDFYMDKYEVSNRDYYRFMKEANSPPPKTWSGDRYIPGEGDFPVVVTYMEALSYCRWAKKNLPTELQWEKAARGTGFSFKKEGSIVKRIDRPLAYPWGVDFMPGNANTREFWSDPQLGVEIKKKYKRGLLPVFAFEGIGDSPFGVVNMSGNAMEWTSSWYRAYNGSRYSNKRFGTQVKVLRGGSWLHGAERVRTTNREIGGLPNLYDDAVGGFRCIAFPTTNDKVNEVN